ncbi:hypothetical protein FQZ97_825710 [compost metagenome]
MVTIQLAQGFIQAVMAGFAFDDGQRQAIHKQQQVRAENIPIRIAPHVLINHMEVVVTGITGIEETHAAWLTLDILHLDIRTVHHLFPERLVGR